MSLQKPLLILVGPTGVGKTAVAIELCKQLDGEIISADSMQLYRGMDIGTAKASHEEQALARHHLIDILNPDQEYSAASWAQDAKTAISDIRARGKCPIVVGGTGFYLTALLYPDRLASAPPNQILREELQSIADEQGYEVLHAQLKDLDAKAAERLHPHDVRRVIRAIEVALTSPSENVAVATLCDAKREDGVPFVACGLSLDRDILYPRLNARVEAMLQVGFMDELKKLVQCGYADSIPMQNLGYRHMRPVLNDDTAFAVGVELWKRDTRRYAKRQMTWFRHQLPVQWFEMSDALFPGVAAQIAEFFERQVSYPSTG